MDFSSENAFFNTIENIACESAEQSVDAQINLPEYCGDIRKILKCFVIPNVFACSVSGDRALCDGEAVIRVLYIDENNKAECYEQNVPFSKYITLSGAEADCCVSAVAKTEYVNCRAVSQRRITVSANLCIRFCVSRVKKEKIFSACENPEFETKSEKISCSVPVAICEKLFEMSETAALSESLSPIRAVVRTNTCAVIDAVKTVSDKMLIKGEMVTDILYCTDGEDGALQKYRHTMPISQIADLEGIDETSLCDVSVKILCVCVSPKADSEGKNKLFDISVKAIESVKAYKSCEVCAVSDGYSTKYETQAEFKNMTFRNHIFTYNETKQLRSECEISTSDISEIIDIIPLSCGGSAEQSDGKIIGKGSLLSGILFRDSAHEYGYTEKTTDFDFECRSVQTDLFVSAEPVLSVSEISADTVSDKKLSIRASVIVSMPIFEEREMKVCTRLEALEDRKKPQCDCPLTVCFPESGEKIWDIARKYNTTCEKIRDDNDLGDDEVTDKKMLLITSL